MKIAINKCVGEFRLSDEAYDYLSDKWRNYSFYEFNRKKEIRLNPELIKCIEELGEKANGFCSELKIIEIPDNIDWYIESQLGVESIHEKHRMWK